MFDAAPISEWMQANQFLAGGIGTLAFGSAMYVVRSVPRVILNACTRTLTTTFTITTRYRQYEEVALLLGRCAIPLTMRNFTPNDARSDEGRGPRHNRGKSQPSNLAPGYGRGWARYKGKFVTFHRSMMENKGDTINEEMEVRFFTRDISVVESFLREAEAIQDSGQIKIHISDGSYFGSMTRKPKRNLESVFSSGDTKQRLVKALDEFLDSEELYAERGIPYKFCAVLHGKPGTGKTSLVHAVASHFDLTINYVTSLAYIDGLVSECRAGDLLVIEDIDALADDLHRGDKEKKKDDAVFSGAVKPIIPTTVLHKLLNAIDGFCTPHGLKVIITTNHPERLDPALLRPGRTDLMLEVGPLEGADLVAMYRAFYGPEEAAHLKDGEGAAALPGSRLQQIFSTNDAKSARDQLLSRGFAFA